MKQVNVLLPIGTLELLLRFAHEELAAEQGLESLFLRQSKLARVRAAHERADEWAVAASNLSRAIPS